MKLKIGILLALPIVVAVAFVSALALPALLLLLTALPGLFMSAVQEEDDESDESAKTIIDIPRWMIEEMTKEKPKEQPNAEGHPAPVPPTLPKELGAAGVVSSRKPSATSTARLPGTPDVPPAELPNETESPKTLIFDPKEVGTVPLRPSPEPPVEKKPEQAESARTAAWSIEDLRMSKGEEFIDSRKLHGEDTSSQTMAYMPAADQPTRDFLQEKGRIPEDAFARTQLYTPTADDEGTSETAIYSPGEREKLVKQLGKKTEAEGADATVAYSKEQLEAIREGYALLEKSKDGSEEQAAPAKQGEIVGGYEQTKSPTKPAHSPAPAPDKLEKTSGRGTLSLVLILVVLLALATGATAMILHFLGVVDLPIALPQLDIFK